MVAMSTQRTRKVKAGAQFMSSKTRDRILSVARDLFNSEGVGALSAMDVATALGISPGHLYYHFKGKAEIVSALLAEFEAEMTMVLDGALADGIGDNATIETLWTHLHIMLEEVWDARFFVREAASLCAGSTDLAARYRRVIGAQQQCISAMLAAMAEAHVISASPEVRDGLARQIVLGLGFALIQQELEADTAPPRERIARAAAQLVLPVAGHVTRPDRGLN